MRVREQVRSVALVAVVLVASSTMALAANMLTNPSFESGTTGWTLFGAAFVEVAAPGPPAVVPCDGSSVLKLFGNWSGPYNVSGAFQEFPSSPGDSWVMAAKARWNSDDPMYGCGAGCWPNNWVVQKIVFLDGGNAEIGAVEATIVDGSYTPDMCHAATSIMGTAPAGTVKVQALLLYIQPDSDPGAAFVDDVYFSMFSVPTENSTWGAIKQLYK